MKIKKVHHITGEVRYVCLLACALFNLNGMVFHPCWVRIVFLSIGFPIGLDVIDVYDHLQGKTLGSL